MARKKQETLTLFPELLEMTQKFTDEQFGVLMRALFFYRFRGELYSGDDIAVDVAFLSTKSQIDRYQEYCSTLSNNAKVSKEEQSTAKVSKGEQNDPPILSVSISNPILSNPKENVNPADEPPDAMPRGSFEKFWSAYPKKVGKQAAKKAFDRVKVPVETLLTAIERQKCSAQWSKDNGQYIPNPATWLNQGRWEDELEPENAANSRKKNQPIYGCTGLGEAELEAIQRVLREEP